MHIYIQPPKYVLSKYQEETKKQLGPNQKIPKLEVKIASNHITIGVSSNPPYISEDLQKLCDTDDSYWCIGFILIFHAFRR